MTRGKPVLTLVTVTNNAGADLLRIVDQMHRDKNIPKEVIFDGIEAALQLATEKHYGEEEEITVTIDHEAAPEATIVSNGVVADPAVLGTPIAIKAVEGAATGLINVATFTVL